MRILVLVLLLSLPLTPALAEPTPSAGYSSTSEQPAQEEVKTEGQMVETSNVPPSEAVHPSTPKQENEVTTTTPASGGPETPEITKSEKTDERKENRVVNLREPNPVEKKNNANVTMLMGILAASALGAYSIAKRKRKEALVKVPAA
ncbi:hypothetical protein [Methanopyrus sp. SNP6]|uniref:hypothetical protein n=1 Tax=Methanopyrus sp. SNP6 TaxID=1937005 RepID=UPI0011E596A4|nr:hypothetical protein [Methanopyrus sp. SNP6]